MSAEAPQAALSTEQPPHLDGGRLRADLGAVSLKSRLGLSRNRVRDGFSAAPPALARTAFYLLSAGATVTLLSLLYEIKGRDDVGVAASAVATYALAIVCLVGYDRLSERSLQLISAAAVALVSITLYYGGAESGFYRMYYVWIALFAAYHFRPIAAGLQTVAVGVGYAVALAFNGTAAAPIAWLLTMATILVTGIITGLLHSRVEAQLQEAEAQNERLRETDRLKDEFLATVSHELRTPLTSIRGYLDLLLDDEEQQLSEEQRRFLEVVERNSQRLLRQVNDLLVVAQIGAGALAIDARPVDLAQVVAEAVSRHGATAAERSLDLAGEVHPVTGTISGDAARLGQLLDVLIGNAIKFTPPGGTVTVRLRPLPGSVELEVVDSGTGIPAAEQPRLFERFYRARGVTADAVPGTGIGLTIALGIVDGHGGTIECISQEGVGSTFRVVLPADYGASAR